MVAKQCGESGDWGIRVRVSRVTQPTIRKQAAADTHTHKKMLRLTNKKAYSTACPVVRTPSACPRCKPRLVGQSNVAPAAFPALGPACTCMPGCMHTGASACQEQQVVGSTQQCRLWPAQVPLLQLPSSRLKSCVFAASTLFHWLWLNAFGWSAQHTGVPSCKAPAAGTALLACTAKLQTQD